MEKTDLIKALEESYQAYEAMYDQNLDKMGDYHRRIEALKEGNTQILNKMKELSDKLHGLRK
jgi:uncharacterized coiled-coil DUF342 family protein